MSRSGYAFRAGLRVNDRIVRINNTFAGTLTLREAQILIRRSGKSLRIYVQGYRQTKKRRFDRCGLCIITVNVCSLMCRNEDPYTEDEYTVDFWFKPRKIYLINIVLINATKHTGVAFQIHARAARRVLEIEDVWNDCFPWNDRKKFRYRESNCFRVPSKAAEILEIRGPRIVEPDMENTVEEAIPPPPSRSPSRSRTPGIPIEDEHNVVQRRPMTPTDRSVSPNRTIHKYLLL